MEFHSKGRLRSAWTHRVGMPHDAPYDLTHTPDSAGVAGGDQHMLLPGDQQQHLHRLHHQQPHLHHLQLHGGRTADEQQLQHDSDTPKKLQPALTFLQQQQQQMYAGKYKRSWFTIVDREILCNALACAGASMADPLMSMVDSYYAGKLGTTALAALGSNGALYSVLYFLCFTALAVLCTQAMASANSRGDSEGCGRGFIQAFTATLVVSGVLVCVLLSVPEQLLGVFQTDEEVLLLAKTYCMIRALSLPAALSINVSQAAFRSMLDLTTPFCIVMAVNVANFLLNELLMVVLPYGMAGCGWASVVSQYMGALLFAGVIYRQRHKFGIPEALDGAEDRFLEQRHLLQGSHSSGSAHAGSSTLVARKLGHLHEGSATAPAGAVQDDAYGSSSGSKPSPHKRQQHAARGRRTGRGPSADGSSPRHGLSPRRSRESSGTLRIDVTAFEQQLATANGQGHAGAHNHGVGGSSSVVTATAAATSPAKRRSSRHSGAGSPAGPVSGTACAGGEVEGFLSSSFAGQMHHRHAAQQQEQQQQQWELPPGSALELQQQQQQQLQEHGGGLQHHQQLLQQQLGHQPSRLATSTAGAAAAGASAALADPASNSPKLRTLQQRQQQQHPDGSSSHYQLQRWGSSGSESKLPRYLVGCSGSSWGRLLLLLRSLDWWGFARRFAGMMTRGLLILSTYTTANLVAASGGTAMMAAHQVVQQQQQLQMSFAWSFLHVGQSMTANLFHSKSAVSGPKAARRLSERIVVWAMCSCLLLALGTFAFREALPTIFSKDFEVQDLVLSAAVPAAVMLGLAWNNALEGCLLAADEQRYVVWVYPCAAGAALLQLGRAVRYELGLEGVWFALMSYYLVLLVGFAGRYWVFRGKL